MDIAQAGPVFYGASYRLGQTWGMPSHPASSIDMMKKGESHSGAALTALLFFAITIAGSFVSYFSGLLCHAMICKEYKFGNRLAMIWPPITALAHLLLICVLLDDGKKPKDTTDHMDSLQMLFLDNLVVHLGILVVVWLVASVRDMWKWFTSFQQERYAQASRVEIAALDEEAQVWTPRAKSRSSRK